MRAVDPRPANSDFYSMLRFVQRVRAALVSLTLVPPLSANLLDPESGRPIFQDFRPTDSVELHELANKLRTMIASYQMDRIRQLVTTPDGAPSTST